MVSAQQDGLGLGGRLAILTIDTRGCSAQDRERCRDDLVAWLAGHNLHLGGDFPITVVYCPDSETRSHAWRAQRRWLSFRLDGQHRLEFAGSELVLSPELRLSAVEAVVCAQMTLAETTMACNLDLQQLASALRPRVRAARASAAMPRKQ